MSPESVTPEDGPAPLGADEVRRRASAGLVVVGTRGILISLIGLASNVVLARLLTPYDFGVAAAGLTFISFVNLLADGGLGGGLIRRVEPPDVAELRALLGLQLVVTVVSSVVIAAVSAQIGAGGRVVAVMVFATPLVAFQFPGKIQLEREMQYRPLAMVEVSQVLAYQVTAIGLVALGAGVWGLALGWFARALVGAVVTNAVAPVRVLRPTCSWHRIKPLVAFGTRLQLVTAASLVRDQGMNGVIGAAGSVATLGLYTLAKRLLEVPYLLLTTLWRISMPAMSQLIAAKEIPARLIERALYIASVGTGIGLVLLAGSSPGLVPGVFGAQWAGAAEVLPGACLGMYIGGSVSVAAQGFLYAVGDAAAVLRTVLVSGLVGLGLTAALLPSIGQWAPGIALFVSGVFEAVLFTRAIRRHAPVNVLALMWGPTLAVAVAIGVGWWVSVGLGRDLLSGVAGGGAGLACFAAGMAAVAPERVGAFVRVVRRALRNARSGVEPRAVE